MPARKRIARRTVFNLLGPLTNPAGAHAQLLGVFSQDVVMPVAETLAELGVQRALVVHGVGGLDEISTVGETIVAEIKNSSIVRYQLRPEDFGVPRARLESLRGGGVAENAAIIRDVLRGQKGPKSDVVAVNAAAALVVAGISSDLRQGMELATAALASGAAAEKLAALVKFSSVDEPH